MPEHIAAFVWSQLLSNLQESFKLEFFGAAFADNSDLGMKLSGFKQSIDAVDL